MVMERKELEKIFTHFQARSRGYLLRKEVRRARADFEALVMEIDGTLNHLQWREDGVVSMAHFTDTAVLRRHGPLDIERRKRIDVDDNENALSMELLWLQQAIASRKKYLSLKQRLSAS
ncbi:hypothetical protein CRUP_029465 [Coryphaenoides rupestris]|nr:hypothetical protein CRUP_029465 [Coryphaenoides rupestris]